MLTSDRCRHFFDRPVLDVQSFTPAGDLLVNDQSEVILCPFEGAQRDDEGLFVKGEVLQIVIARKRRVVPLDVGDLAPGTDADFSGAARKRTAGIDEDDPTLARLAAPGRADPGGDRQPGLQHRIPERRKDPPGGGSRRFAEKDGR